MLIPKPYLLIHYDLNFKHSATISCISKKGISSNKIALRVIKAILHFIQIVRVKFIEVNGICA